jgi:hypothetical protein
MRWTSAQQFLAHSKHKQGDLEEARYFLALTLDIFGASCFFGATAALVLKLCCPPFDEHVLISEFSSIL